jgi:hypothetical protein
MTGHFGNLVAISLTLTLAVVTLIVLLKRRSDWKYTAGFALIALGGLGALIRETKVVPTEWWLLARIVNVSLVLIGGGIVFSAWATQRGEDL